MNYILIDINEHVATITISREKVLNALNAEVLAELSEAFDSIDTNQIRCVILTGAGEKSFVAGADIASQEKLSRKEGTAWGNNGNAIFRKIETFPVPVIAAVNGFALGGGLELAMACDIRIASDNAIFGQPETGLGITPGFGGTQRLARLISPGKAKEMIYAGTKIRAAEALSLGLVNAVYTLEELMPQAQTLANRISGNGPIAVRAAKKAINEGLDMAMDDALALEAELFGSCFETEDQQEAMRAFLEKRKDVVFKNK